MGLSPSPMELMFLAVLALVILGPNKLPEAARSLGKGMREMRDSFQGAVADKDEEDDDDRFHLDDIEEDDDEEFHDDETELDPVVEDGPSAVETGSAPQPVSEDDHQKDAESSVPSASSSSTERE